MTQQQFPPQQQQQQPGKEKKMTPRPQDEDIEYRGSQKLDQKVALITGGDSGIGRAVALAFAKEGADIAVVYLNEHEDAKETQAKVEQYGQRCVLIPGDIGEENFCKKAVELTVKELGRIDILVNGAAEQHPQEDIQDIAQQQLERTFRTNIFSFFYFIKAALKYLKEGSAIINTTSVTAYRGSPSLLDYSSTKGAIVSFTRSLSKNLAKKGIRVNAVSQGLFGHPLFLPLLAKKKFLNSDPTLLWAVLGSHTKLLPVMFF